QVRHFLRRGFPRHVELACCAERGIWTNAAGTAGHSWKVRAGGISDVANRGECGRVGAGKARGKRRGRGGNGGSGHECGGGEGGGSVRVTAGLGKPGDEGQAGAIMDGWDTGLSDYTPQKVEKISGVTAARIERLAKEFAEQRPAFSIAAGAAVAQTNGLF